MNIKKDSQNLPEADRQIQDFRFIAELIEKSRQRALAKVNEELITLYFNIGQYLSEKAKEVSFGDAYIDSMTKYIESKLPGVRGFTRRGLYRMKQFYETYHGDEFVSPLVTQISWTNHLLIMSKGKSKEERHFYIKLCLKERYSKRELERQINSAYYERYMLSNNQLAPELVKDNRQDKFLDSYVLEFLNLPAKYSENDFKKAIIQNFKNFLLEIGKDFSFVGEEYKVQVGDKDFYIDLLFYHRSLSCLVAFELKIGEFQPEYISKMNFYLEALDREYKKEHENPSVGIILCTDKNDDVVEYALSRSLTKPLVAEYTLQLPQKQVLQKKLKELAEIVGKEEIEDDN